MKNLWRASQKGSPSNAPWACESAIVAVNDDPDRLGRIKVIIPSIDEDNVFDDWIVPAATHCMGDGFGMLMIPPKGAEVIVSGVLGQKHNFVYHAAVYNEEMKVPAELNAQTPGFKVPANFFVLAALLIKIQSQNLHLIAEQLAKIEATNIESIATQLNKMQGQNATVEADQALALMGNTVTVHSDGSMTIQASGNIAVTASGNLTLQGRTVNKVGPAI